MVNIEINAIALVILSFDVLLIAAGARRFTILW